ncbi:MAG: hypothetical protein KGI04_04580 [Candidatus Micrarchaeota archaeon]|nr:hypothetical protein [Candidatus Micrarchaeota archaeon]
MEAADRKLGSEYLLSYIVIDESGKRVRAGVPDDFSELSVVMAEVALRDLGRREKLRSDWRSYKLVLEPENPSRVGEVFARAARRETSLDIVIRPQTG